jgi:(p)ppGpp synthase/HD superfamily hydrolase
MGTLDPLTYAVITAAAAHAGQTDKAGLPYILHPLRMVLRACDGVKHPDVAVVAALHDVVEDTSYSLETLRRFGFSDRVVSAVEALTRRKGESYEAYLTRVDQDGLTRIVKRLDIDDNLEPARLERLDPETARRLRAKYEHARSILGA